MKEASRTNKYSVTVKELEEYDIERIELLGNISAAYANSEDDIRRAIASACFIHGMTIRSVAELFGRSTQYVHNLTHRYTNGLRRPNRSLEAAYLAEEICERIDDGRYPIGHTLGIKETSIEFKVSIRQTQESFVRLLAGRRLSKVSRNLYKVRK